MLIRNLALPMLLICNTSYALETTKLSEQTLKSYGQSLEKNASNFQWQMLWANTKEAGHFDNSSSKPYFTLKHPDIDAKTRETLRAAQEAKPYKDTNVGYKLDFADLVVGMIGKKELTAICVYVNLKNVDIPAKAEDLEVDKASLLLSRPC